MEKERISIKDEYIVVGEGFGYNLAFAGDLGGTKFTQSEINKIKEVYKLINK